jgi:hypothetical protein
MSYELLRVNIFVSGNRMLKHVHAATHPAQLQKPEPLAKEEASSGDPSKEELFAVLALEAEEENQEKG